MTTTQTFAFGRNWRSFSRVVSEDALDKAKRDILAWLGPQGVAGKTVLDIGSGSGIHSLCFHRLGAASVVSLDVDPQSVACTRRCWEKAGKPANWRVEQLIVLDSHAMDSLGRFDLIYSWGVLHHTGRMWDAIGTASALAKPGAGRLWISLYADGPNYELNLAQKRRFNRWPWLLRQAYVFRILLQMWRHERSQGKKLRDWFWRDRGMNAYHDTIDWLGGLPYEVASVAEVTEFLAARGWAPERIDERAEGDCSIFLFRAGPELHVQ